MSGELDVFGDAAVPTLTVEGLTGRQKAAVLLAAMEQERAGAILQNLKRSEVTNLMMEVASLGPIPVDVATKVLNEFNELKQLPSLPTGDFELARTLLENSLGSRVAKEILRHVDDTIPEVPFAAFDSMDPEMLAKVLAPEHPQITALVLSYVPSEVAAAVLIRLPEDRKSQVGLRVGTLGTVVPDAIVRLEQALTRIMAPRMRHMDLDSTGGTDALVDLLNKVDKGTSGKVFEALDAYDEALANEIRARLFVFDDIVILGDRDIQLILRSVDNASLPLALKGVRDEVRDKILDNLSNRARKNLLEEIELLGQVRITDVEEAQSALLQVIAALEESGEVVISRGGDEFVS